MSAPRKAALIGGGVIGGGWAARLLLSGVDAALFDPDPQAERKIGEILKNARHAFDRLLPEGRPAEGSLTITGDLAEAVAGADFIQESAPERVELKQSIFAQLDELVGPEVLIASSTSGIKPTDLQVRMKHPERLVVGHPFNPVYLLPLVEIVGGEKTAPEAVERARALYSSIGMKPLVVRKEIEAFIADRLMEALWREALWLVKDGIATTEEIDDAIRYGCGLRWAQMGTFQVFQIAGGEAGMRHFMAQFGPCLKWPWTKLMDVPEMTDELVETIALQCDAQAGGRGFRELERIRDENLVDVMKALEANNWGAGAVLKSYRASLQEKD
jgi:carnitine 3-dehydrogenase